jgi:PAS domain S-box-containing protein
MSTADPSDPEGRAAARRPPAGTKGGGPLRETQDVSDFVLASSQDSILVLDLDGNTMFVSPGGIEAMEVDDVDAVIGHSWLRVWKGADYDAAKAAVATARAGHNGRFQGFCATRTGKPKWWDAIISPLPGASGFSNRLVVVCRDITQRRVAELRQAFLLELSDKLRRCEQPLELLSCAVDELGRHLGAHRVGYGRVEPDDATIVLEASFVDGVQPLTGSFPLNGFGAHNIALQRRGVTVVHDDLLADKRHDAATWGAIQTRAFVSVPLVRDGAFRGALYVNQRVPRRWTEHDIAIIEDVAARIWDALERARAEQILRANEAQFRALAQAMPNHVWTAPANGLLDWFNDRVYDYSGAARGSLDGEGWASMVHPEDLIIAAPRWAAALASGQQYEAEFRLRRADGAFRWHLARAVPLRGQDGGVLSWVGTNTDIDDQKTTTKALAHLNEHLEREVAERTTDRNRLWRLSSDIMLVARFDAVITAVNPAGTKILGWPEDQIVGKSLQDFVLAGDFDESAKAIARVAQTDASLRFENRYEHKDGGVRWISWTAVRGEGLINAVGRDLTADKEHAEALHQTEIQLRQAQKMEAIGQLTGGVAHDFNNILQVISANLNLLMRLVPAQEKVTHRIDNALGAVRRGAQLASQLLAFGRRQPLEPKVVNVGRLLVGMEDMLRRALGSSIEIETVVSGGLWHTLVDPTQIESALLNLAINARDAMDGTGKLTLEASNASLDDAYAYRHLDVSPGQYVLLAVTDTGCGMAREVIEKAFDPFFSTKAEGRGTGLGLSMVYGFVKQSGGHVKIYSEVGHGTVVKIYLPRSQQSEDVLTVVDAGAVRGGAETILVAEDDEDVRSTVVEMLTELGYFVVKAKDAASALAIIESGVVIDLLFTDVVMPGPLKSPELARQAQARQPSMAVLFTSGYTENAIVHGGRLDPGVHLLPKPYGRDALALKVRQVLGARASRSSADLA